MCILCDLLLCVFDFLTFSDEYNRVKLNFMRGVDGSDYIYQRQLCRCESLIDYVLHYSYLDCMHKL